MAPATASKYDPIYGEVYASCLWDTKLDRPVPIAWSKLRWVNLGVACYCLVWTIVSIVVSILYPSQLTIGTFYSVYGNTSLHFGVDSTTFNAGYFLAILPFTMVLTRFFFVAFHQSWFLAFMNKNLNYIRWGEVGVGGAATMFVLFLTVGVLDFLAAASMACYWTVPICMYAMHESIWDYKLSLFMPSARNTFLSERRLTKLHIMWIGTAYKCVIIGLLFFFLTENWQAPAALVKAAILGTLLYLILLPVFLFFDYSGKHYFRDYAYAEAIYLFSYLIWGTYTNVILQVYLAMLSIGQNI